MNILVTGRGSSGSWKVRGVQLGKALGATVKPGAGEADIAAADIVVLVKRPAPGQIDVLRRSKVPWVWDVVDFYPQPECSNWSREHGIAWVTNQLSSFAPWGVVWPNAKMRADCGEYGDDLVLYHHGRPGRRVNPVRDRVRVVGYEGSRRYLGRYEKALKNECKRRGWKLLINEGEHADFDIAVAFRDRPFAGYVQRSWKSNVKLANCHATGTPFIGAAEDGYLETQTGLEMFLDNPHYLAEHFDLLEPYETRRRIHERFLEKTITLESCADTMLEYLRRVYLRRS
jgi:hypothetical protein